MRNFFMSYHLPTSLTPQPHSAEFASPNLLNEELVWHLKKSSELWDSGTHSSGISMLHLVTLSEHLLPSILGLGWPHGKVLTSSCHGRYVLTWVSPSQLLPGAVMSSTAVEMGWDLGFLWPQREFWAIVWGYEESSKPILCLGAHLEFWCQPLLYEPLH